MNAIRSVGGPLPTILPGHIVAPLRAGPFAVDSFSRGRLLMLSGPTDPGPVGPPRPMNPDERHGENKETVSILAGCTTGGAALGSAVLGPGVGTVVGAAGGAIVGLIGSWWNAKNNEEHRRSR